MALINSGTQAKSFAVGRTLSVVAMMAAGLAGLAGGTVLNVTTAPPTAAATVPVAATLTDPTANGHSYRHGAVPQRQLNSIASTAQSRAANANSAVPGLLSYGGGFTAGGLQNAGVTEGQPSVYLVFYGNQWGTESINPTTNVVSFSNDPENLAPTLQGLYSGLGTNGESWSRIVTQYCDGVTVGATSCPGTAPHVPYPSSDVLAGVWYDTSSGASSATAAGATGHDLAMAAAAAATNFGNTTQASNRNTQYIIVSPTGYDPDGWLDPTNGYCAYHDDSTDPTIGGGPVTGFPSVAFTNMPYVPDVGSSCGAGSVNQNGVLDGATEAASHEYAETLTDQFPEGNPPGGWTDASGNEIGDKCAYLAPTAPGAAYNLALSTGSFAVQGMWSNLANGCVQGGPIPSVTAVSPSGGPGAGGTAVTIRGSSLKGATSVMFGSSAASRYSVNAAGTIITAYSPPELAGAVDITVTVAGVTSSVNAFDKFTFLAPTITSVSPASGSGAGGAKVVIRGTSLQGATSVLFDIDAAKYTVNASGTVITAFSPAHVAGPVAVSVTTPGGTVNDASAYTYVGPSITRLGPTSGVTGGNTRVVIIGQHLQGATASSVLFGIVPATSVTVNAAGTSITAFTPAEPAATVPVTVTTPGGTSGSLAYTYH